MPAPIDASWDEVDPHDVPLDPAVTSALYRKWRSPRCGQANPERMNNPVWEWLVRSRVNAYALTQRMGAPSALEAGPGWCFDRIGQSQTTLPEGDRIFIAGEHEDFYDPDFYIYNDVVVLHPDRRIDIFGYPREILPPADAHSAILAGDKIFIIGGLGYPEQRRPRVTPVFCLDTKTFAILPFANSGPAPGEIHGHSAELTDDGSAITLRGGRLGNFRNINEWRLSLDTGSWTKLTDHRWQIWQVARKDGEMLHLWQIRSQLQIQSMGLQDVVSEQMRQFPVLLELPTVEEEIGGPIDLQAASSLFQPLLPHELIPDAGDPNIHRIRTHAVIVRYEESLDAVEITVEGELPQKLVKMIVDDLKTKLARLERSPCTANRA